MAMIIPSLKGADSQHIGSAVKERMISWSSFPILRAYNIWALGTSSVPEGAEFSFWRPRPDFHQVLITLKGEGRGLVERRWQPLSEGHAYLIPAYSSDAHYTGGEWQICWCFLKDDGFSGFKGAQIIRLTNSNLWKYLIFGILEESSGNASPVQMERWAGLIHYECSRIITEPKDHTLWRLWSEVLDHLDTGWSLSSLARTVGLNRETLRQRCIEETGVPPMAYVTRLRMRHAAGLLESGYKVESTARMVGYENAFAFSVAFQRLMGMSPSTFRRHGMGSERKP